MSETTPLVSFLSGFLVLYDVPTAYVVLVGPDPSQGLPDVFGIPSRTPTVFGRYGTDTTVNTLYT